MTTFTMQDLTINNLPTTTEEDEAMKELFEKMGQDLTAQHAPVPQPTLCEPTQTPDLATIINTICTQLQLLSTVISQTKAQPSTTPPEGANLQDCVEQVLTQAVWFEKMVEEQVESRVEDEVESYFQHGFDPSNYFDFDDAIANEVHDRIDDAVRDRIDEAVADKMEDAVDAYLSGATISISK
jgi:soluble cytochrome b562